MRYATAAAFRQALDDRLTTEASRTGLPLARLRKQVAFELFLRRLVAVATNRWVLKGALALELRLKATTRPTRDIDLGRDDDEQAAIEDITAAQQLVLDDFFTYAAIRSDQLDRTDEFASVRFHVNAQIAGRTFEQFTLDIGFTDSIPAVPDTIKTSGLLAFAGINPIDLPAPAGAAPRREGPRLYTHLRRHSTTKHSTKRPGRHPPDRSLRTDRCSSTENGARDHLRRTPAPPTAEQPAHPAYRMGQSLTAGSLPALVSNRTYR
jgi:hypothetical protein